MYRYERIVHLVQEWLERGNTQPGRSSAFHSPMSAQSGLSPMTIQHSYGLLESEGLIRSTPRSGYYVADQAQRLPDFSTAESLDDRPFNPPEVSTPLQELFEIWQRNNLRGFGSFTQGGDRKSHRIDTHRATIMALLETSPDITIEELRHDLSQQGLSFGYGTIRRASSSATRSRVKKRPPMPQNRIARRS